jgi:glycosyltransferase involved in cell wall biosynthesis
VVGRSKSLKRIAIDCRPLIGQRAGIGRYLYKILEQFALRNDDAVYYLYAPGSIDLPNVCKDNEKFIVKIKNFSPAILWLHAVVPIWILKDKIDVFWGPNYALPIIKLSDYRSVITVHDMVYARFPDTMLWKTRLHNQVMVPLYVLESDLVLTDSEFSKSEILKFLNVVDEKVKVIYLAADAQNPTQNEDYFNNNVEKFILSVGTIEPRKNFEAIVKAYSQLDYSIREKYKLVVAGHIGWGGLNPLSMFQKYHVMDTAQFIENATDEQIAGLYKKAALFIYPSLYEGFGLPVLEAMMYGVPTICSANSSMVELYSDTALLCDPNNLNDIIYKMEILLSDEDLRLFLNNKFKNMAQKLTWEKTARQTSEYLGLYN